MTEQKMTLYEPRYASRSTLLVPYSFFIRFFNQGAYKKVGDIPLSWYLAHLLEDPLLEYKLSFLKPGKWKTEYQKEGQELQRVNFYPDERDWGRLSAIANATGFSRCYIFIYLLLIDMGVLSLKSSGTHPFFPKSTWNPIVYSIVVVDAITRKLTRKLQL